MNEIVRRILEEDIFPLREAKRLTISELVKRYGDPSIDKVFTLEDYQYYLLNTHVKRSSITKRLMSQKWALKAMGQASELPFGLRY